MNDNPTTPADDERHQHDEAAAPTDPRPATPAYTVPAWAEAPHVDASTLRSAYAFDGSGPYLYGPDGSGPYTYTHDGRGPYLVGSAAASSASGTAHGRNGVPSGHGADAPGSAFGGGSRKRRHIGLIVGSGIAALAIVSAAGGTAFGLATRGSEQTTSSQTQGQSGSGQTGTGTPGGTGLPGGTEGGSGAQGGSGSGSGGTSTQSSATPATDSQKAGVVTIVSTLDYDTQSQAAGTGMIISSDGEVLTNNHVIDGATSITVTVESTGKQYTADVVGTDSTDDVAVLKLRNASGLTTSTLDTSGDLAAGDAVTDVGNAEGTGNLVSAGGTVTALNQSIQVQSESGTGTESLSGLIEVNADVVSGDSGGPILDADGEVVGMTTAASSGSSDVTGYAIPIQTAKSIADRILAGKASSTVTIGLPAFLGLELSTASSGSTGTTTSGVALGGVVAGSPAAKAGLAAGDVITSIDGTAVTGSDQLSSLIKAHAIGDTVTVGYTTADGTAGSVTATLVSGPAD
ncbi:S1C family serine protease [Curtobacterium sp. RRHDQ10]|uniref:S1C family serine protease n=1 Tax=Curtobacterium phyllosphaerae TaxID=3413379 RepID=UPI003BF3D74E